MRVDAHVTCGACQTLVFPIRDVLVRLWIDVLLRQAKVDDVDGLLSFVRLPPNQEVLRLDIAVDQVLLVDVLHPV